VLTCKRKRRESVKGGQMCVGCFTKTIEMQAVWTRLGLMGAPGPFRHIRPCKTLIGQSVWLQASPPQIHLVASEGIRQRHWSRVGRSCKEPPILRLHVPRPLFRRLWQIPSDPSNEQVGFLSLSQLPIPSIPLHTVTSFCRQDSRL
jgi:hypothetical protein